MAKHFQRDMELLKRDLLYLGSLAEEATTKAIAALVDRRPELAREVLDGDDVIDAKEVQIEEECLKILALHQPVAGDLRFIIVCMKVTNELERMGDLAVNIAERAAFLCKHDPLAVPLDFSTMVEAVWAMVRNSLDALFNQDTDLARIVLEADDIVDAANREMYELVANQMRDDPSTIERALHYLSCSRHLERMGDQATNIAEDVLFMVNGEIVRHRVEDYLDRAT